MRLFLMGAFSEGQAASIMAPISSLLISSSVGRQVF